MSILVVGISHASAPVATLEKAVITGEPLEKLLQDVRLSDNIAGALVISTCNRIEFYAEVDRFHGGVASICDLLARHSGLSLGELTASAYVHYEDRAVQHLLAVVCGLDSMVVGESQILGQVRQAVRTARQHQTLGRELSDLSRVALRAARRAHAETGIDAAGRNLVAVGIGQAVRLLGRPPSGDDLAGLSVAVIGAGSMSALTVATATRQGAARIVIANRTRAHAERLAAKYGAAATDLSDLPTVLAAADLVVTCTGAVGHVLAEQVVRQALRQRAAAAGPLVLLDLALPRDVEPSAAALPGIRLVDLETISASAAGAAGAGAGWADAGPGSAGPPGSGSYATDREIAAVKAIVAAELAAYLKADRAASVAPTVVGRRAQAATVVESELARLERRLGDLDARSRREIAQAMGRIADKLLHGPTIRVKELAGAPGADSYDSALRVLFGLDPEAIDAVGRPDEEMLAWPAQEATQ
ncbi:MAG: glutamyl-tRNA reductase [Streptosporangiaceae bacterium]